MPLFFFDVEADSVCLVDDEATRSRAAEIMARHFYATIQATASQHAKADIGKEDRPPGRRRSGSRVR